MFKQGISKVGDLLDLGTASEIIRKSGANYSYNETRLGQGRENAKAFLNNHPEIAGQIEALIRAPADNSSPEVQEETSEMTASTP